MGVLVAVFMTSLCTEYYQFFLAQALLLGISMSFITWPPVAVVARHLPQHRGLAMGLVIGGSSLGGLTWPIILQQLLYHTSVGFGWTMRVVGFIMLPLLAVASLVVVEAPQAEANPAAPDQPADSDGGQEQGLQEKKPAAKNKADFSIVKKPVFLFLCLGLSIGYLGLFAPIFYVSAYAVAEGVSSSMAFYLISILNAASMFGRILPGILADRWGHFNFMIAALGASAIIGFCWTAATNVAGLVVWSIMYGFTSGVSPRFPPIHPHILLLCRIKDKRGTWTEANPILGRDELAGSLCSKNCDTGNAGHSHWACDWFHLGNVSIDS